MTDHQREILLLRYLSALENAHWDTLTIILRQAETDARLDQMIRDLHRHLDAQTNAATDPSPNGRHRSVRLEQSPYFSSLPTIKETQPMTALALDRPQRTQLPWTLVVAALLAALMGSLLLLSPTSIPATLVNRGATTAPIAASWPGNQLPALWQGLGLGGLCFDLSEADCEILTTANENMWQITSFTADFTVEVSVAGLEALDWSGADLPNGSLSLAGSATVVTDDQGRPVMFNLDLTATNAAESASISFAVVVVDGYVYVTKLENGAPVETVRYALEEEDWEHFGGDIQDAFADIAAVPGTALGLPIWGNLDEFVTNTRLDAIEGTDQTPYPFELRLNLIEYLRSEEFIQNIIQDPALPSFVSQLMDTLLADAEADFTLTQYVGATDQYIHRLTIAGNFAVDWGDGPITANGMADVVLHDINTLAAADVVAPEGENITTLSHAEMEDYINNLFNDFERIFEGTFN